MLAAKVEAAKAAATAKVDAVTKVVAAEIEGGTGGKGTEEKGKFNEEEEELTTTPTKSKFSKNSQNIIPLRFVDLDEKIRQCQKQSINVDENYENTDELEFLEN
jgi:hypothetical protein